MHINAHRFCDAQGGSMTTQTARALALAAIACLVAMVTITLATGVSQEFFEMVRPVDVYGSALARAAPSLRAIIGIDTLFLSLYALFFVVFAQRLVDYHRRPASEEPAGDGAPNLLLRLGVTAIVVTAFLDAVEDHHILAMAQAAGDGRWPTTAAIDAQQLLSQLKFNVSYFGLFAFGLGMPRRSGVERVIAWSIALVMPLLGAVLWALPLGCEPPLDLARWAAFVAGFAGALVLLRGR
jgi:hypothetical protein